MPSFEVIGGKKLQGEIIPQGAKNEALQIISAVLLTPGKVTISNIPDIIDVNLLIELLADMGVKTDRTDRHTCMFQADDVDLDFLESEAFRNKGGKVAGICNDSRTNACTFQKSIYTQTRWRQDRKKKT